jgi:hypothetical protein
MTIAIGVLIAIVSAAAGGLAWSALRETEERLYQAGQELYQQERFAQAADKFDQLLKDYSDSSRTEEYDLLSALSRARDDAEKNPNVRPEAALQRLGNVLDAYQTNPHFLAHRSDAVPSLEAIVKNLATAARAYLESPKGVQARSESIAKALECAGKIEHARALTKKIGVKGTAISEGTTQSLTEIKQKIALAQRHLDALIRVGQLDAQARNVKEAQQLILEEELQDDPEAQESLQRLRDQVLAAVAYTPKGLAPGKPAKDIGPPRLLVVPSVQGAAVSPTAKHEPVFALARGILYALDSADGRLLWACRVGIDTTTLPFLVPALENTREIVLVLSADRHVLTARDRATGHELWQHNLESPCLGRPLLVGHRVYVPTFKGSVHEIDVRSGSLQGSYYLGMPLTVGGARQEGTDLLYFPADSLCVYVLDVKQKRCVGILQTDHPSGSLRTEPFLTNQENLPAPNTGDFNLPPGYLVLSQTDGLGYMKLRPFRLPIEKWVPAPAAEPFVRIPGWCWFAPYYDGEKIAVTTDLGSLHVIGVNQINNQDPPLFPLAAEETQSSPNLSHMGRGQVVHAEEHDFWVLTKGELQRVLLAIGDQKGLQLVKVWPQALGLGSPLHEGQVNAERDTLYVVTQPASRRDCLATAVTCNTGEIQWQRLLGMVSRGDPLLLGEIVVTVDQGGGMHLFDPVRGPQRVDPADPSWRTGGEVKAAPFAKIVAGPYLVPGPDGTSALEIACVEKDSRTLDRSPYELILRRIEAGKEVSQRNFPLPEPLAGTPGIWTDHLVLPLADGWFVRQALNGKLERGLSWRAREADHLSRGHVVSLGAADFLVTDGLGRLSRWNWSADVPKEEKSIDLGPGQIVGPPLLLPATKERPVAHVCIADNKGTVTLVRSNDLSIVRRWNLRGPITGAPFQRGERIGCVVDRRRLVWLDADRNEPAWQHEATAEIVGQPQLVHGLIAVADISGRFIGLDPSNGHALGDGYRLAGAAPAAAPIAFGASQLFAPLTDGTILLLSTEQLRGPPSAPAKQKQARQSVPPHQGLASGTD